MGMGEPLMNYNNMMKAIEMITSSEGSSKCPKKNTRHKSNGDVAYAKPNCIYALHHNRSISPITCLADSIGKTKKK
jgi:hypothetical protein